MAKIILFPIPKIKLTPEETEEYNQIKEELDKLKTLRELYYCRKKVKEFRKRIDRRLESEKI